MHSHMISLFQLNFGKLINEIRIDNSLENCIADQNVISYVHYELK